MPMDGLSEDPTFDVTSLANKIFRTVGMADGFDILMNDRAFIEIRSDIVRGGADHLHATCIGLMIGFGTFEPWQERMMDVDATP